MEAQRELRCLKTNKEDVDGETLRGMNATLSLGCGPLDPLRRGCSIHARLGFARRVPFAENPRHLNLYLRISHFDSTQDCYGISTERFLFSSSVTSRHSVINFCRKTPLSPPPPNVDRLRATVESPIPFTASLPSLTTMGSGKLDDSRSLNQADCCRISARCAPYLSWTLSTHHSPELLRHR